VTINESEENDHKKVVTQKPIDNNSKNDIGDRFLIEVLNLGFCQAKCVEQCITVSLKELDECKAICRTNNLQELCVINYFFYSIMNKMIIFYFISSPKMMHRV